MHSCLELLHLLLLLLLPLPALLGGGGGGVAMPGESWGTGGLQPPSAVFLMAASELAARAQQRKMEPLANRIAGSAV